MTRQESVTITKRLIRQAKTGEEITMALKNHFKKYIEKAPDETDALLESFYPDLNR